MIQEPHFLEPLLPPSGTTLQTKTSTVQLCRRSNQHPKHHTTPLRFSKIPPFLIPFTFTKLQGHSFFPNTQEVGQTSSVLESWAWKDKMIYLRTQPVSGKTKIFPIWSTTGFFHYSRWQRVLELGVAKDGKLIETDLSQKGNWLGHVNGKPRGALSLSWGSLSSDPWCSSPALSPLCWLYFEQFLYSWQ